MIQRSDDALPGAASDASEGDSGGAGSMTNTAPSMWVAGFSKDRDLRAAHHAMREAGAGAGALEVYSNVPLEELGGGRSRVLWFALAGGLLGGLSVFLLAAQSAKAYPLVTGGMPIVALPVVGLVAYEGIALGAILATVLGVLLEAGLLRRGSLAPEVARLLATGHHVLVVDPEAVDADAVRSALDSADSVEAPTGDRSG